MTTSYLRPNVTRVQDSSGFVGTVLYVGPVASAKSSSETYVGIAWDDATRGKHDGSVICRTTNELVRHFKCGPTQGSFLRLALVDTGVALTPELMRSRYVKPDAELVAPDNLLPHVALTSSGREKPIEFLGEMKIRRRQQLEAVEEISLRILGISRPCSLEEQSKMVEFEHLKGIDLAGNLLSDWQDVLAIVRQFPRLQSVSLASNRISDLDVEVGEKFLHLRTLNLNNCNIGSFKTMQLIGLSMPNLEELCLAHAELSDIENFNFSAGTDHNICSEWNDCFQNLILLDLSDCHLSSWKNHLSPFHTLPKLESLIINDNPINFITIEENVNEQDRATLPSLVSLQLAGTAISSWNAIDDLNHVSSLRSLRLQNTPLTNSIGVGEARSTAIARHPNLEYFNASPISERERREAERHYVSAVARELLLTSSEALLTSQRNDKIGDDEGNCDKDLNPKEAIVYAHHPQFRPLLVKHKESMIALSSNAAGSVSVEEGRISYDVINVTIRSMAASSCVMEPLRKRLPRSLKVGSIKAICSRAFGIDTELQILQFRAEGDPFPIELTDIDHSLAYYGVTDGAEIFVNEIDVEAKEKEKLQQAEEHKRLIEEQENYISILQSIQKNDYQKKYLAAQMSQQR